MLRSWPLEEAQAIQNFRRKDGEETVRRVDVRNEEEVVDRRSGHGKKMDRMELLEVARGRRMRRRRRRTDKEQVTGSIEGFQKAREEEETELKTRKEEGLTAGAWCITWRQVAHTCRPCKRGWRRQERKEKRSNGRRRV